MAAPKNLIEVYKRFGLEGKPATRIECIEVSALRNMIRQTYHFARQIALRDIAKTEKNKGEHR